MLLDYETRDVVVRGLAMPHSPRWYRNRLWVLESSRGTLATVDPASGKVEIVARVPGFARGLDFVGPLAFIGLSQLRETNTFTDIVINEDNADRRSGVWVVNIENGETIAILKFGEAVQEIFAVQIGAGKSVSGDHRRDERGRPYDLRCCPTRRTRKSARSAPETSS